jgi:hypothetical protein
MTSAGQLLDSDRSGHYKDANRVPGVTERWGSILVASAGPQVGELAPDFELRHTFSHSVHLAEVLHRGPVLLAFYVFDFGFV